MVIVVTHSKWPEIVEMKGTSAKQAIAELHRIFTAYGLPQEVVSKNGPQFASEDFQLFMKSNGIKHTHCSPYHPSSNGFAKRMVQTFKKARKSSATEKTTVSQNLSDFLFSYHTTPHSTANDMPCHLFLGRS